MASVTALCLEFAFLQHLDISLAFLTFTQGSLVAYSSRKGATQINGFCIFTKRLLPREVSVWGV